MLRKLRFSESKGDRAALRMTPLVATEGFPLSVESIPVPSVAEAAAALNRGGSWEAEWVGQNGEIAVVVAQAVSFSVAVEFGK